MNTKNLMVSLCAIVVAMLLAVTVSACVPTCDPVTEPDCDCCGTLMTSGPSDPIAGCTTIELDGMNILNNPSVIAGETVSVEVTFTAEVDASDVRIKAELEGDKVDVYVLSKSFDVEAGHTYSKTLALKVPSELKDELSDDLTLSVRIWNGDYESEFEDILVRVQRPSYNPVLKSVSFSQSVDAGETFPVDLVLKNMGYNDLDDIYVTISIPELGVEKTSYFGDLVSTCESEEGCDDDEDDTVSGRLYLEVPYDVEAGVYDLEVEVTNDDVESTVSKQISVKNDFSSNVIVTSSQKSANVGEEAEYSLLLVNPTNSLKVYRIVAESSGELSSGVDESVVAVPAGSSKTVTVKAKASEAGAYDFKVHIFSGEKLTDTVTLSLTAEESTTGVSNPIVVLTVVLAIIFLVLLIVLIVLLGRKPKKQEEFGESYY
jgi:hypothetical protein